MSNATEITLPLRHMRESAGLSPAEAAEKLSVLLDRPIDPDYLRDVLERRGTKMYEYIKAMAVVYNRSDDEVYQAAKSTLK